MTLRRLFISSVLSLVLIGCFASAALAAPASDATVSPGSNSACFQLFPKYQKVAVGEEATLGFYGYSQCPITPNTTVTINVTWGDGAVSVVPICTAKICPAVIPGASHAYKASGTYYPRSCINIPGIYWLVPPCITAQVDVS
jgi:hypothetical protein